MSRRGVKAAKEHVYRITFLSQGSAYEIYARQVSQGGLFGFVEVEEVLFQERSRVVIDPTEDRLRSEFEGVRRFYVPLHAVLRIDEVERRGAARITPTSTAAAPAAESPTARISAFPLTSLNLPPPTKR